MPSELNGSTVDCLAQEKHLGIQRSASGKAKETITMRIQVGRHASYKLIDVGLCGINRVSPEYSMPLIDVFIILTTTHGLEALRLTDFDYNMLEKVQHTQLRMIQQLPQATTIAALYLITGSLPMQTQPYKKS